MRTIAFLSDFGTQDGYPAVVQGVIRKIAPKARYITISNDVFPQDIQAASRILRRCIPFFPKNTIFLAIIDPGVGTRRRCLAAQLGPYFFVGPDNGLITPLVDHALASGWKVCFYDLDRPRYWLSPVSSTFHGRDIFAPVAAYIARGVPLRKLGSPLEKVKLIRDPLPVMDEKMVTGEVIAIDHFGNLISNIPYALLKDSSIRSITCKDIVLNAISESFEDSASGKPVAYLDSDGTLAIAVSHSNAARKHHAKLGDKVQVMLHHKE